MADLHRELLEEQFSDAALRLLMDEYAEASGAILLDDFCRNGTDIPAQVDERCQKQIQRLYKKTEKSALLRRTVYRAAKIGAVFFAVLYLSANLIMSVEALRIPCLNLCIRIYDYFTEFRFDKAPEHSDSTQIPIRAPEGYTLIKQSHNYDDYEKIRKDSMLFLGFQNDEGSTFFIQTIPSEGSISLDTEDSECITFFMNGMQAFHITKNEKEQTLFWIDEHRERAYNVYCSNMDKDEFRTYVLILSVDLMKEELYIE